MNTVYTKLKVNNEVELCELQDLEFKEKLEKELLKNRISYFMKWGKAGFFSKKTKNQGCILCVNDNQCEQVEEIIKTLEKTNAGKVKMIKRKSDKTIF